MFSYRLLLDYQKQNSRIETFNPTVLLIMNDKL